jgi:protein-S-isoprenylcysteine O-methyltransferase Ste14
VVKESTVYFSGRRVVVFRTLAGFMQVQTINRPSLKNSWAYQSRVPITALVLIGTWAYVVISPAWVTRDSPLDWVTEIAAWAVFLGGSLMRIWATLWIAGRKKQNLVDDGPYRMCRNPLYIGTFAMGLGLVLFLKSLVFAVGVAAVLFLYQRFVVPAEENYMRSRFAEAYDDYCALVPRWLPKLSRLRRDEVFRHVTDRQAVYRECLRMACWMLLPILAEITCHVRGTADWNFLQGPP